jgi:hypothetical protein
LTSRRAEMIPSVRNVFRLLASQPADCAGPRDFSSSLRRGAAATLALVGATALLLGMLTPSAAQAGTVVYSTDFESGAGSEWSSALTETTPGTMQHPADRFLGRFGNGGTTLSLTDLPPHSEVTVSLSLYLVRSWDGNSDEYGPDTWDLSVLGGPTLLHTTFSNLDTGPCIGHGFNQAYPETYPGGSYNQNLWIDHPFEGAAYLPR